MTFDKQHIEVIISGKWKQVFAREIYWEYYYFVVEGSEIEGTGIGLAIT